LTKRRPGRLIFNNANTYNGPTIIIAGVLNARDSQALGASSAGTTVGTGAALELEVDTGFDAHGRNLAVDSVTGTTGNGPQLGLTFTEPLTINGQGILRDPTQPFNALTNPFTGALHSISGINQWLSGINLSSGNAGIGVEPDPHPSN